MVVLLENAVSITSRSRADRPLAKARSRPEKARYNGRSREARLVRSAVNELKAMLGDVLFSPLAEEAVRRAAELGVIASDLRAKRLRGEPIDVAEIVKAENATVALLPISASSPLRGARPSRDEPALAQIPAAPNPKPEVWVNDGNGLLRNRSGETLSENEFRSKYPNAETITLNVFGKTVLLPLEKPDSDLNRLQKLCTNRARIRPA